ncbi:MAG: hypothetical protein NTW87_35890 [Planctomycetota bacterium]|nr:hypothetical protein [Planctomycetota bacterium]
MAMADDLARIKKSAKELKGIAEEATALVGQLHRFLKKNPPGIEVWGDDICYERVVNCRGHVVDGWYVLGYARSDEGEFTLVLKCIAQQTDENGSPVYGRGDQGERVPTDETVWVRPLNAAPRELRIAAISYLPDLMSKLALTCESATKKAQAEMGKFDAAAHELKAALHRK